jgi:hypothetical protein
MCISGEEPCLEHTKTVYKAQFFSADGRPLAGVDASFSLRQAVKGGAFKLRTSSVGSVCFRWYERATIDVGLPSVHSARPPDPRFATVRKRTAQQVQGKPFYVGAFMLPTAADLSATGGVVRLPHAALAVPRHVGACPEIKAEGEFATLSKSTVHRWIAGLVIGALAALALAVSYRQKRRRRRA